MEGITSNSKLLAQDDIDALLGEAGLEGGYSAQNDSAKQNVKSTKSVIRFAGRSDEEVKEAIFLLRNKAFLEREDNIKVIWNALGTIPMVSGYDMRIQETDYMSLGVLYENHLVVRDKTD